MNGERVFPPEFWIIHSYRINMSEIAKRDFSTSDKILEDTLEKFTSSYKDLALKLWDEAATINNNVIERDYSKMYDNFFTNIVNKIKDIPNFTYGYFVMSPSTKIFLIDYLNKFKDDNYIQEILNNNRLLGQDIIVDTYIPEGTIYFSSAEQRSKIGFATRIELTMLPADQFVNNKFQYGYLFGQMICMYLIDTKKVLKFKI